MATAAQPEPVPPVDPTASTDSSASTASTAPSGDIAAGWPIARDGLKGLAKALYAPATAVSFTAGVATLAVPSTTPIAKLKEHQKAVETALTAALGQAVRVELVPEQAPKEATATPREPEPLAEEETSYDPSELVDAPSTPTESPIDRLVQAFPGARLVDESKK